jgi:hypothetical protein
MNFDMFFFFFSLFCVVAEHKMKRALKAFSAKRMSHSKQIQ